MSTGSSHNSDSPRRFGRKPDYSHPSVAALIREAGAGVDPYQIVRERCRSLAMAAKRGIPEWKGPPYNPFHLASSLGIKVCPVSHDIGGEARIYGTSEGVRIEYRPDLVTTEERLRFSIFHEIAHTVFDDCYKLPRQSNTSGGQLTEAEKEFERMCDAGAGELLFPHDDILSDLNGLTLSLHDVCNLKRRYKASPEAAVRRCLDLTPHSRAAVFLHKPADRLAVKYFWKSQSFQSFIQPGFVPPESSVIHFHSADELELPSPVSPQLERWQSNGRISTFQVQVIALPAVNHIPDSPKFMAFVAQ